jgi:hypothetical protein
MSRLLIFTAFVFCFILSGHVVAQSSAQRAQELAIALDKTKYKKKEKKNILVEVYVDIKNDVVVKNNPEEYSGGYETSDGAYRLDLRVSGDGSVEGGGHDTINGDDSARISFTLKDARVEGALLTATKVYAGGSTEKFEAVFTNRTSVVGKNADDIATRDVSFGLGFIQANKSWTNRVFLEAKN